MYTIYLCDRHPFGECPFAVADCQHCKGETVYEEEAMIVFAAEAQAERNLDGFTV